MNFNHIVGRLKYDGSNCKAILSSSFKDIEMAKRFAIHWSTDILPNSVFFVYDCKKQEASFLYKSEQWKKFESAILPYDSNGEDIELSNLMWKSDFQELIKSALSSENGESQVSACSVWEDEDECEYDEEMEI